MADSIKISNLDAVVAALKSQSQRAEVAAKYAVGEVGLAVERQVKLTLNNNSHSQSTGPRGGVVWTPRGHVGGPGTPPNRRTGHLHDSITTEMRIGLGTYVATVYPTMIYARRLEEGLNYPYMRTSADAIRPRAKAIFQTAFLKKWRVNG